jgi:hypothetical protein
MDLGALIGEYPVDNRRRGRIGSVLTGAGVVAIAVGVPLVIADANRPLGPGEPPGSGADTLLGGLVGVGGLAVLCGVVLLIRVLQTRGHAITLYEGGIVRRAGGTEEAMPWADIAEVRLQGTEANRAGHLVGIDFRCAVRRQDGRRFAFSSHTANATELATALHDAVHDGKPPKRP